MDSPKISRMWSDLQKASSRLRDSSVLLSCEPEIEELMRQVDLMVDSRKQEWSREKRALQAKLDVREQELVIQRTTLSQKHTEIGQLRLSLDNMEQTQNELRLKYETDLANLREQVCQMNREYDKLQRRYLRRNRDKHHQDSADDSESKKLSLKLELENCRQRSTDLERERHRLMQQVETLQLQNKALVDQCSHVTQTSAVERRRGEQRNEAESQDLKSQVAQLSGMFNHAKDTINSQEVQLSRLRASLDETSSAHRKALSEKEKTECDLGDAHRRIRQMEEDVAELRMSYDTQCKLSVTIKDERTRLGQQVVQLQVAVQEKDNLIQSLQKQNATSQNSPQLGNLQKSLSQANSDIKKYQHLEQQLRAEVHRLQSELGSTIAERDHFNSELVKMNSIRFTEKDDGSLVNELRIELDVKNSQLSAACIENRHLRSITTPAEVFDSLQAAYAKSLQSLERHNSLLQKKISQLSADVKTHRNCAIQGNQREMKIAQLEKELFEKDRKLQNLGRANEAMNDFVNGVDHIVQSSPAPHQKSSATNSTSSSSRSSRLPSFSSTLDGSTDLLLSLHEDRSRELEDILSQHIDSLRAITDDTLCKYIVTNGACD